MCHEKFYAHSASRYLSFSSSTSTKKSPFFWSFIGVAFSSQLLNSPTTVTVSECRFRYCIDGVKWENDWCADKYEPNPFGSYDSVVVV
jgi:hypothetical protein